MSVHSTTAEDARTTDLAARRRVLVFAPVQPAHVACGVSSAVRAFVESAARERYEIELRSTLRPHRQRGLLERLAFGSWLVARSALQAARSGAVLADIHAVSDRSLLSHAAIMFGIRLSGRPAVLRIHGGDFHQVFERAAGAQRVLIRFILRSATRVVVLSERWRSRVQAIEPRCRLEVIPNPVNCRVLELLSARELRPCRRILFLANLCERKGHFDALAAIAALAHRYPDLTLALGGDDRDPGTRARLEEEAWRLGVAKQLEFLGTVSGEAKARELQRADVLILPSHTENMPVSIIEGMAAGLPVIGTAVGAVPEMIDDGRTGFVIEPRDPAALADRLDRLFSDAALGRRLGLNAQRHARATWDADLVAERTLALYARLQAAAVAQAR